MIRMTTHRHGHGAASGRLREPVLGITRSGSEGETGHPPWNLYGQAPSEEDAMRKDTAMSRPRRALADATEDQARDVVDILRLGAGDIWHEDAILTEPADVPSARRWAYVSLAEAIRLAPEDDWIPVHTRDWEEVFATLILEGDWDAIRRTAEELRSDTDLVRARRPERS
jgi:hypothetical protein